ncbi:MAG: hypothetical protein EOL97_12900 [Spirochaetia bacterium]|nr:hypothetical protein [Spirochaetia bacterium]
MGYNTTKTNKNGIVRDEANTTTIWAEDFNELVDDYVIDKNKLEGIENGATADQTGGIVDFESTPVTVIGFWFDGTNYYEI